MSNLLRHIIGYTIGFSLFILLIPYGLVWLGSHDPVLQSNLNEYLLIRIIISCPFFIIGLIFAVWSNIFLLKIGKGGPVDGFNIAISPRTKKLVTIGPYRYSRNPMVFGAFCFYFSIGLFMLSVISIIILLIFLEIGIFYLKRTEEKRLLKDFGDEYLEYKKNVPMIFPRNMEIK